MYAARAESCAVELFVLGAGQDAGAPQIGNRDDPAWSDKTLSQTPTSIAIVDRVSQQRFLFETTPSITQQLQLLDTLAPDERSGVGIDGVFLTHAHIGHYAGLMYFGREAAGARSVQTWVMPRFADYLASNGPWGQLVELGNIDLQRLSDHTPVRLNERIRVTPYRVPHRDEYSETVGFVIATAAGETLFLPDIDGWDDWQEHYGVELERVVADMELLFVDATFFDDNELPGRDMSEIPHPRVADTMERLSGLDATTRQKLRFIHYNHTNPIRYTNSAQSKDVEQQGFSVARAGDRHCLLPDGMSTGNAVGSGEDAYRSE